MTKAWVESQPLVSAKPSPETGLPRFEAAKQLAAKAISFEEAPQNLLSRVRCRRIVQKVNALYAHTNAYLHSDKLYEEALTRLGRPDDWSRRFKEAKYDDLHYKIVVGQDWSLARLALVARYQIAGAVPFEGTPFKMLVHLGYDEDDRQMYTFTGYEVNTLILAPQWVCNVLRTDHLKPTPAVGAASTCSDTVIAMWRRGMFNASQDSKEMRAVIKAARHLDSPRPQHLKVS